MTGGGPAHASEVLATAIYFDGFQKLKFGYASAEAAWSAFVVLHRERLLRAPSHE